MRKLNVNIIVVLLLFVFLSNVELNAWQGRQSFNERNHPGDDMQGEDGKGIEPDHFNGRMLDRVISSPQFLTLIEEKYSEIFKFIKQLEEKQEHEKIADIKKKLARLEHIRRRKSDMFSVTKAIVLAEIKIDQLSYEYKYNDLSDNEKKQLKETIEKKLSELFDKREQERENIIRDLEKRVQKERRKLKFRQKNKGKIIKRRVKKLLESENKDLEW